jgi:beta-ketoacyl-acyl-carrier-protein synthase II
LGTVSPVGNNVSTAWENLKAGRSGISFITRFDTSDLATKFAGEIKDFDANELIGRKEARRMDRYTQYALVAVQEAVAQAGLTSNGINKDRVGLVIGSCIGGVDTVTEQHDVLNQRGVTRLSPFGIPMMLPDTAAARIAIDYGFRGPNMAVVAACATGTNAVGEAFEIIARGSADVMIAGGAEAGTNRMIIAGFNVMGALSTYNEDPTKACRPFDLNRNGFVLSEGAAVLVLEELEHAKNRGAAILAEVIGYGASADAFHMAAQPDDGGGAKLAMQQAINRAGISPTEIDYINTHGTGTPINDRTETMVIKAMLGEHAYKVHVTSSKSMTGHLFAGAGALEAVVCVKTLTDGIITPTINYETPDPECDLNYTPNEAVKANVSVALSNSFGLGGHNATIIIKKYSNN